MKRKSRNRKLSGVMALSVALLIALCSCGTAGTAFDKPDTAANGEPSSKESKADGFTDAEIAELSGRYGDTENENGPSYVLVIESISEDSATIMLSYVGENVSPVYESDKAAVSLHYGNAKKTVLTGDFEWTDNWDNAGVGTVWIEKTSGGEPRATVNVKTTRESPIGNRATLATGGDRVLKKSK